MEKSGSGEGFKSTGETPVPPCGNYFDPEAEVGIRRRNLPHWDQEGALYFVTFRLADSLPAEKLERWKAERESWLREHPEPWSDEQRREYGQRFTERIEHWLDQGAGSCLLKEPKAAAIVGGALEHFHRERYLLDLYVVMPNHVHVLFWPLPEHDRPAIVHSWKSYTAHEINKALGRKGVLRQEEPFDHLVRHAEQHERLGAYIANNPKVANLQEGTYLLGSGR